MSFNNGYPTYAMPYAYGNPYGRGYGQPYPQQPQPQPSQPYMNQPTQQTPQPNYEMPIQNILFTTSEEAKAYIVMPNQKVLLIDRATGIAHLKFADNMGQSQTQYFKFQPVDSNGVPLNEPEDKVEISFESYVTKDELNAMGFARTEDVQTLSKKIDDLQKMVGGKNVKPTT